MKKVIIILLLFFISPFAYCIKSPLKIAYFHDFYPYSWQNENGQMEGVIVE